MMYLVLPLGMRERPCFPCPPISQTVRVSILFGTHRPGERLKKPCGEQFSQMRKVPSHRGWSSDIFLHRII